MADSNKTLLQQVMEDDVPWWKEAFWFFCESVWVGWVHIRKVCIDRWITLTIGGIVIAIVSVTILIEDELQEGMLIRQARAEAYQKEAVLKEAESKRLEQERVASRKEKTKEVRGRAKDNWTGWYKTFGARMNAQCYHGDNFATDASPAYTITCHLGSKEYGGPPTLEVVCTAGACTVKRIP